MSNSTTFPIGLSADPLKTKLCQFIDNPQFPCVGAKAALSKNGIDVVAAQSMTSAWDDLAVYRSVLDFVQAYRRAPKLFRSLAIVYDTPRTLTEEQFERFMWERLQSMSDKDVWMGQSYDSTVSHDPTNPHFALSFGGEAFFAVGLHPKSSRKSRRFVTPTIILNVRDQFEQLRADNRYERMRATIIDRDEQYSGSINPMLSRHGDKPEAAQYSGRAVDNDWQCPFNYDRLHNAA